MRNILFIFLLLSAGVAFSQEDNIAGKSMFTIQGTIATGSISSFSVDNLGNLYVLSSAGFLKKMNAKGDSLNVFNDVRRFGGISLMDVTNPLKILLYYRDFSTILMLDRFLNQLNTIDLRKAGIFQAKAVGLSYDNNIWVYDEQAAKLKKIDEEGKVIMETTDLRQVLTVMPSPDRLIDRDGFVYLYDATNGLYVFDYYGMLKNELPLTGVDDLQVIGNTIVGSKKGNFIRYTLGSMQIQELALPDFIRKSELKIISPSGIYIYDDRKISKYTYQ